MSLLLQHQKVAFYCSHLVRLNGRVRMLNTESVGCQVRVASFFFNLFYFVCFLHTHLKCMLSGCKAGGDE